MLWKKHGKCCFLIKPFIGPILANKRIQKWTINLYLRKRNAFKKYSNTLYVASIFLIILLQNNKWKSSMAAEILNKIFEHSQRKKFLKCESRFSKPHYDQW